MQRIYQAAYHLFDKHHAVQTALLNLMDNGVVVATKAGKMEVGTKPKVNKDRNFTSNPFKDCTAKLHPETVLSYDDILYQWFRPWDFEHVPLYYLTSCLKREKFNIAFYLVVTLGIIRLIQGFTNDLPLVFLVFEIGALFTAMSFIPIYIQDERTVIVSLLKAYTEPVRDPDVLSQSFSFNGRGVLASFGAGYIIAQVFPRFDTKGNPASSNCTSGSCTSSGCSSGGDGGGCSGGCGGCGGGGD